jgi:hypothetical protein
MLSIHNLASLVTTPLAGFHMFDSAFSGNALKPQPAVSLPHGTRDTLVQIIVIKDETNKTFDSVSTASNAGATELTNETAAAEANVVTLNNTPIKIQELARPARAAVTYVDSIRLIETSKVPLRGEYNPSQTGRFVIVFSN